MKNLRRLFASAAAASLLVVGGASTSHALRIAEPEHGDQAVVVWEQVGDFDFIDAMSIGELFPGADITFLGEIDWELVVSDLLYLLEGDFSDPFLADPWGWHFEEPAWTPGVWEIVEQPWVPVDNFHFVDVVDYLPYPTIVEEEMTHAMCYANWNPGVLGLIIFDDPESALGTVVVAEVDPNTNASAVGILPGDVILAVDGMALNSSRELVEYLGDFYVGDIVQLLIAQPNGFEIVNVELVPNPVLASLEALENVAEEAHAVANTVSNEAIFVAFTFLFFALGLTIGLAINVGKKEQAQDAELPKEDIVARYAAVKYHYNGTRSAVAVEPVEEVVEIEEKDYSKLTVALLKEELVAAGVEAKTLTRMKKADLIELLKATV